MMDAKGLYDGLSRQLSVSTVRDAPKTSSRGEETTPTSANGEVPVLENGGLPSSEEAEDGNANSRELPAAGTEENHPE